jgi:hypothetical protein
MECTQGHLLEIWRSDLLPEPASQEGFSHNLVSNTYWHQGFSVRPIPAFDPSPFTAISRSSTFYILCSRNSIMI